ncbi:sensor histidine kinase [Falsiroseomonas sp. HW251]|uniref:sensor histidine kinase n=1 Tax=Falsiroseomonas sp. HW251 TaxID=3390998 RepID=UPI003D31C34A
MRRSFALRASLAAAAVMLVASFLGSGWIGRQAEQALRAQLDLALAAEAESLIREYEALGLQGLAEQTAAYARRRGPVLVLLQAPDGRPLAGGLPVARPPVLRGYATLDATADRPSLRVLGAVLPGGANLLVATELAPVEDAASRLAWGPPVIALAAAALALLLGFLAARRFETRLAGVGRAARAIMDGDLARRLPDSGRGDEFDRLVGTVNTLLGRIEALVAAQRQVTDDIAHDLRTPLSRLRQRLEGALVAAREPSADEATLAAAIAELDAVLATFAALLRIARAESGSTAGFAALDLSALVAGIAETYAAPAEEAGRALTTEIARGIEFRGDAALLRQALANLLDNAILHGGGRVALRLKPGPVIEVADDGPGIPPAEREAVTRRFYRLDSSRHTPGTGLGLALVAAAARLHGGSLRIEDGPGGRGVTAVLDLRRT